MELRAYMQTATWLVSRALSHEAGPWDTRLLGDDDGEYFCRVMMASDAIRFVPGAKVYYRMSPASLSHVGLSERKLRAQFLSMRLQIAHVIAREDTPRVRAACVRYLQHYMSMFFPEWTDIVRDAAALADALGGTLSDPTLPGKYAWLARCCGWPVAKRAQVLLPQYRWLVARWWDRTASRLDPSVIPTS
jgi:hypothetical protein